LGQGGVGQVGPVQVDAVEVGTGEVDAVQVGPEEALLPGFKAAL
jgi:hypothetical protein